MPVVGFDDGNFSNTTSVERYTFLRDGEYKVNLSAGEWELKIDKGTVIIQKKLNVNNNDKQ